MAHQFMTEDQAQEFIETRQYAFLDITFIGPLDPEEVMTTESSSLASFIEADVKHGKPLTDDEKEWKKIRRLFYGKKIKEKKDKENQGNQGGNQGGGNQNSGSQGQGQGQGQNKNK